MATFDLTGGGGAPKLKKTGMQSPPLAQQPTFNDRREDDPYGGQDRDPQPAAPAPAGPATPTIIPPPTHDPYAPGPSAPGTPAPAPGAPSSSNPWAPDPTSTDPWNGTMFDPRLNDPGWANTPEGLTESNRQNDYLMQQQQLQNGGGGPRNGDYRGWFTNLFAGKTFDQATLVGMEGMLNQYGIRIEPANAQGERHKLRLPDGSVVRVGFGEGVPVWIQQSGPGGSASNNPFDDPATRDYIDRLNRRLTELDTPQQNPEMDQLLQYLTKYFQQLQGPTYTDAQRDVINTQSIDPMEHQRTARKQQVLQQMESRGMGPNDGPTIQAMQDVDREFDQMRTQAQGGFALNEINLGRQNQQQAVDVGSAAAQLRNGIFSQQDQRSNQALGIARQIPDMAQQRIQQAIALLNGNQTNPASLFGSLQGFNQQDNQQNQQDSQYWTSIMAAIAKAFGLG